MYVCMHVFRIVCWPTHTLILSHFYTHYTHARMNSYSYTLSHAPIYSFIYSYTHIQYSWVEHHVTVMWGQTSPMDGPWGVWPSGGAWLSRGMEWYGMG